MTYPLCNQKVQSSSLSTFSGFPLLRSLSLIALLVAVDELTGLIAAVAFVRPSKNIADVELKSIKKKWKEKAFAAGVHREEIEHNVANLGVPLDEHIQFVLSAMQRDAASLGLAGIGA